MKRKYVMMLMAAAGVFGPLGCKVGPDYVPPEVGPLSKFERRPPDTASIGSTSTLDPNVSQMTQWWTTLQDPLLNDLVRRAAASNIDLKIAESRLREARARLTMVSGNRAPQVGFTSEYSREQLSHTAYPTGPLAGGESGIPLRWNLYDFGFDASWELDVFGGLKRSVEAAQADMGAMIEDRRDVLVSTAAEIARNYVELRGLQHEYQIAQRNLAVQQQTLELIMDQKNKGTATQLDVDRAAAQVSATKAEMPTLQERQWQSMHRLAVLLGTGPEDLVEELSPAAPIPVPPQHIGIGLPSDLLRRRPDIRRAERQLAASTARLGVAAADLFPRFSLTGSAGLQSSNTNNLLEGDSNRYFFGPSLNLPIFNGGQLHAMVKVRTEQQEQCLMQYQQTVLTALREVEDAIVAFRLEQQRRQFLQETVSSNQEAEELAQQLYRNGLTDYLTVLDAQRSLYKSQEMLAVSEKKVTINLVVLYKALGGGWEPESTPVETPETMPPALVSHSVSQKTVLDVTP